MTQYLAHYYSNVFHEISVEGLHAVIPFEQRHVKVYGKTYDQPRLTKWFGPEPYTYSGLTWPKCPMPKMLDEIRVRVMEKLGIPLNSVLANYYRGGHDHIHWHSDDEALFGMDPEVASVSFGLTRTFEMRRKSDHKDQLKFELEHGSLLHMPKGTQREWQHRVPKASGLVGARINLTFRQVIV